MTATMTIYGQLYSMKNSRTPAKYSRKTFMHPKAQIFARDFAVQLPRQCRDLKLGSRERLLRARITVFYPSYQQDVDAELIYDLLQENGVVSNDRWIRQKLVYGEVDPKNPRVEIILEEI